MGKKKIAISIDSHLLEMLDGKVDGSLIRSRSQAIEFFLKKGIVDHDVESAFVMLHKDHIKHALSVLGDRELINHQIAMFRSAGINNIYIITQKSPELEKLRFVVRQNAHILIRNLRNNVEVLRNISSMVRTSFVVINGDTFNNLDLSKMIRKHKEARRLATVGVVAVKSSSKYGSIILEGDIISSFSEKAKSAESHLINNGIYIFEPEVIELLDKNMTSLEYDFFPKIAKIKQLSGYVSNTDFVHFD